MNEPRELTKEELDREFADMHRYYVSAERNIRGHIAALEEEIARLKAKNVATPELIQEMRTRAKEIDLEAAMKFSDVERERLSGIAKFISDAADYAQSQLAAMQAGEKVCRVCNGNDGDKPCAFPSEGMNGCLLDIRLSKRKDGGK